ncbi:hypothetical protein PENSTE_c001G04877 [Penicillium steckii]|uniref:Histone-lysine N-methyltransferase SET5 n=1 Tax=Penicillium steckii TaxID=303698 RepID=A0A1V6U0T7_9EURO|nr:hypothetical protein PENSTE_c001G04877 [Penicillium steckii]
MSDQPSTYTRSTNEPTRFLTGRRGIAQQKRANLGPGHEPDWTWVRSDGLRRFGDAFKARPPWTAIRSAEWPPKPGHTGKTIDFGSFVTKTDAKLAYDIWKLADDTVGDAWKNRDRQLPTSKAKEPGLANNVYEHLMIYSVLPLDRREAPQVFSQQGLKKTWNVAAMIDSLKDKIIEESPIRGVTNWTSQALKNELKKRDLSAAGNSKKLQQRLIDDEVQNHCGIMPTSDLSQWGIKRKSKFILQPATNTEMTPLDMYTFAIHLSPYNPTYWLSRAYCHYLQGYFDLALGDAYRAQIICNTVEQLNERNSKDGFFTHIQHAIHQHILVYPKDEEGYWSELITLMRKPHGIQSMITSIHFAVLNIICLCLAALNCWDDFDAYTKQLSMRAGSIFPEKFVADLRKKVSKKASRAWRRKKSKQNLFWFEKHQGAVSAERSYPYENNPLEQIPEKRPLLGRLTEEIFQHQKVREDHPDVPTDTCQVKMAPDRLRYGVFAKRRIRKGELIHFEEPTIRGHLPPRRLTKDRTHTKFVDDHRCEHCLDLVNDRERRPSIDDIRSAHPDEIDADEVPYCTCLRHWLRNPHDKKGLMFCPSDSKETSCLQIAYDLYHYDGCGRNWTWLYDTMRPNVWTWSGMQHISHSNEVHGTHLSLLLRSVAETTLLRREDYDEPGLAPYEIDEILILNGNSKSWRSSWFPFTMSANIIVPFDIFSFLGINIFRDFSFDTWALQIIMRKLLVNAVPWDMKRRGNIRTVLTTDKEKILDSPAQQVRRLMNGYSLGEWDPSFLNLYLFSGLSLFNHTCAGKENAEWAYDSQVLNRVIVWAKKNIEVGEEIRIRYQNDTVDSRGDAARLFGGPCLCPHKSKHNTVDESESDEESTSKETSVSLLMSNVALSDDSSESEDGWLARAEGKTES